MPRQKIPGLLAKLKDPKNIAEGEVIVRRRGCFACHDIHGMEKEGRIAPELSSLESSRRVVWSLVIILISHTTGNPGRTRSFRIRQLSGPTVSSIKCLTSISEEEIESLMVLLKGFNGANIPQGYQRTYSQDELTIERGRRLIERFNCRGCHVVEGKGGEIQKYLKAKSQYPLLLFRTLIRWVKESKVPGSILS